MKRMDSLFNKVNFSKTIVFLSCLMIVFGLTNCGRAYFLHPDIDLVGKTQGVGSILIECNGPELPTKIVGHMVTIDGQKPFFVENFSRQQVIVTTGWHTVSLATVASVLFQSHHEGQVPSADSIHEFGKKVEGSLYMIEGGAVIARYTPPTDQNQPGKLAIL